MIAYAKLLLLSAQVVFLCIAPLHLTTHRSSTALVAAVIISRSSVRYTAASFFSPEGGLHSPVHDLGRILRRGIKCTAIHEFERRNTCDIFFDFAVSPRQTLNIAVLVFSMFVHDMT